MTAPTVAMTLDGVAVQTGKESCPIKVDFYWSGDNPAEVDLTIHQPPFEDAPWMVARTVLLQAYLPFHRGAWAGTGSFAACHVGDVISLALKPTWIPRSRWAFARVHAAPLEKFLADTQRLVPAHSEVEHLLTAALVDRAIAELLK